MGREARLCVDMDADDEELVERLLALIGAMLEDASAVALLRGERSVEERVNEIARVLAVVIKLCEAARVLT